MNSYILDTDHITLYQNGDVNVGLRFDKKVPEQVAVTIISFEEQVRGRLAAIRRAKNLQRQLSTYNLLETTLNYFIVANILPFTEAAAEELIRLRQQKIRVGSQDMKIAAIALSCNRIVVTRNRRDFGRIPGLIIEDWSVEQDSFVE